MVFRAFSTSGLMKFIHFFKGGRRFFESFTLRRLGASGAAVGGKGSIEGGS